MRSDTVFNLQARDANMYIENNTNLSDHVDGNAKRHNVQCHNDYTLLQYTAKFAMLLQG